MMRSTEQVSPHTRTREPLHTAHLLKELRSCSDMLDEDSLMPGSIRDDLDQLLFHLNRAKLNMQCKYIALHHRELYCDPALKE
jgi:hypothetical protein